MSLFSLLNVKSLAQGQEIFPLDLNSQPSSYTNPNSKSCKSGFPGHSHYSALKRLHVYSGVVFFFGYWNSTLEFITFGPFFDHISNAVKNYKCFCLLLHHIHFPLPYLVLVRLNITLFVPILSALWTTVTPHYLLPFRRSICKWVKGRLFIGNVLCKCVIPRSRKTCLSSYLLLLLWIKLQKKNEVCYKKRNSFWPLGNFFT